MDINKRSRADLKQYFVKNAIPTEKQFADLIDGLMSLKDDGITKLAGNPLCIEASGDDTSQKKILHLYNSFSDTDPTWVLSLNPRQDPSKPDTAKAGLNISDNAGNSRLFIDKTSGNIGLGTIEPTAKLEIVGDLRVSLGSIRFNYQDCQLINLWREVYGMGVQSNTTYFRSAVHFAFYADGKHDGRELNPGGGTVQMCIKDGNVGIRTADPQGRLDVRVPGVGGLDRFVVNTTTMWDGVNPFVTIGAGGANGLMIANPHIPWNQTDSRASIRYGINLGTSSGGFWDVGVRNGNAFSFAVSGTTDHKLWLDQDGSVKIAGSLAVASLTVKAGAIVCGNSELYFTNKDHNHTGIGNQVGHAAIENAKDFDALMILGRVTDPAIWWSRKVEIWEHLKIIGNCSVGGSLDVKGQLSAAGAVACGNSELYFTNKEHNYIATGNQLGHASIQNAKDFNALMILGRTTDPSAVGSRKVELWDHVKIIGDLSVGGEVSVGRAFLKVRGAGNEQAVVGGDGGGNDVHIGSMNAACASVIAYNSATGTAMNFTCLKLFESSDERLKENIETLDGSLGKILQLRCVVYNWKIDNRTDTRLKDIGLVAQEVRQIVPEAVSETRGLLSISYNSITALLVNAVQEQQRQIEELRTLVNKQVG